MLVGRERERQELDRVLATARSGRSAVLALVGEPGIGKTALLEYAEEQADPLRVLRARGIDSEAHVPFAGLLELLRPALGLLDRIPPPQAAALEGALALRPGAVGERFAIGAATLSLLAAHAEASQTLVLVDDAHSLDRSSAEALLFALRRLLAEPLCAILSVREGEPSLLDGADLPTLHVEGLDREAAATLVGAVPEDVAERLYRATAGNPLALIELAAEGSVLPAAPIDLPVSVPARIASSFLRRAEALDDDTRRLLVLVAARDSGATALLARAAASLGHGLAGLDAAETVGLVRVAEGRVEFRHPLARAAIYGDAPVDDRREAHRALAAALPDREPELAVTMLAEAVDAAFFAGAPGEMLRAAGRARELLPAGASVRAEFLAATAEGMALVFGGEGERGIEAFRGALELAEDSEELR